ncbi:MGH1-like glycoside hydrolase domain-containing protein [Leifsonia sp. McL0607]|uniref:MGH1-like glycoside hydrolase domain-containing protein n=1 Tax=Leifsonia sp. McL0607 TaxID=3415672 RepID=UPI003CEC743E
MHCSDPDRFATPWTAPTVARREETFSEELMWHGPVWVNVNPLLAEGLAVSGHASRIARADREDAPPGHPRRRPPRVLQPDDRQEGTHGDDRVPVVGGAVRGSGGAGVVKG